MSVTRPLRSEEKALWAKLIAGVRPLHRQPMPIAVHLAPSADSRPAAAAKPQLRPLVHHPEPSPPARPPAQNGLDGGWERRIARGLVQPDILVDLHGLSLAAAHALIEARLDQALASDARVILLITGKPPQDDRRTAGRGRIRGAVEDWIAASGHAADIAAVRPAHRRHGGGGALYIILRRRAARHRQNS